MFATVGKQNSGLPYGCLITRILQFYKVSFTGFDSNQAKDQIDVKNLTQSNLKIVNGSLEHIADLTQPTEINTSDTSASPDLVRVVERIAADTSTMVGNHNVLVNKISELEAEMKVMKTMLSMVIGKDVPVDISNPTPPATHQPTGATTVVPDVPNATDVNAQDDSEKEGSVHGDVDV